MLPKSFMGADRVVFLHFSLQRYEKKQDKGDFFVFPYDCFAKMPYFCGGFRTKRLFHSIKNRKMKKIALIFAAVVAVSFASCCGNKCGKGECADSCQVDSTCAASCDSSACSKACTCDSTAVCDSACVAGACVCAE